MKTVLFLFNIVICCLLFTQCSNSDDEANEPYTAYKNMPYTLLGTWTYKISGATNIDATLVFMEDSPNNPMMSIKINNYNYYGKPYYPTQGGYGAIYFKLEGKASYSKLSWTHNPSLPYVMRFTIENVEDYIIDKSFQKKH